MIGRTEFSDSEAWRALVLFISDNARREMSVEHTRLSSIIQTRSCSQALSSPLLVEDVAIELLVAFNALLETAGRPGGRTVAVSRLRAAAERQRLCVYMSPSGAYRVKHIDHTSCAVCSTAV